MITAQTTRLSAEETALSVLSSRLQASVALIEAVGGGWDASQLPCRSIIELFKRDVDNPETVDTGIGVGRESCGRPLSQCPVPEITCSIRPRIVVPGKARRRAIAALWRGGATPPGATRRGAASELSLDRTLGLQVFAAAAWLFAAALRAFCSSVHAGANP